MIAKVLLVIAFVAVAVAVGIYCRRHTGTVDGFILGGRNVGPVSYTHLTLPTT